MQTINLFFTLLICTLMVQTAAAENDFFNTATDTPEAYTVGRLNGQEGWSNAWNSPTVQDDVVFDGTTALKNEDNVTTAGYRPFASDLHEAGVMSMKIRIDSNTFSDNQDIFGLYKGIGEEFIALFRFGNNFDNRSNTLLLSTAESAEVQEVTSLTQGSWHKISLGWRRSDFHVRFKIDNGAWSEWFSSQTTWSSDGPLGMKVVLPDATEYGDFYQDDIATFVGFEDPIDTSLVLQTENTATATVSTSLKQLSIALATTSITANLDEGYIVTATFDSAPEAINESLEATSATTTVIESSIGGFIMNIVESVIDAILPEPEIPTEAIEPAPKSTPLLPGTEHLEDVSTTEEALAEDNPAQEAKSEIQSIQTDTQYDDEVITTTF